MNHLLSNRQTVHDIILHPNSYDVREYIMKYDLGILPNIKINETNETNESTNTIQL